MRPPLRLVDRSLASASARRTRRASSASPRHPLQAAAGDSYVALGDSYSSGVGADSSPTRAATACAARTRIRSVNILDFTVSYHPTADGHAQAYYPVFASAAG